MLNSQSRLLKSAVRWMFAVYAAILFSATHTPVPGALEDVVSSFDKYIHFSAFFVLGLLAFLSFCWGPPFRRPSLRLLLGMLAYAGLDEYLQGFTNRTPDIKDWCSDSLGILVAYLLVRALWMMQNSSSAEESQQNADNGEGMETRKPRTSPTSVLRSEHSTGSL